MEEMVSIIVPVYNVKHWIVDTLDSVEKQTFQNWELILVLDGCTDGTDAVVDAYAGRVRDNRIRIFRQPNRGAAEARNFGLREANGRYIAYLDADDLWLPDKLRLQIDFMRKMDCAFSFTSYEFADQKGRGTGRMVHAAPVMEYRDALKNTAIFTSTVMFDTAKIEKAALEMPRIKSEDTALWWRILRGGYSAYGLDESQVLYRRGGASLSSNKLEALRRIWNLYRRAEKLGVLESMYYFAFWAVNAVRRRV